MLSHITRKLLLCSILINIPFTYGSDGFFKRNITHISWFTALLATGSIAFGAGYLSNKSKYTHLENEAVRKQEAQAKQIAEQKQRTDAIQHKTFNKALTLCEKFENLFKQYEMMSPDELKDNIDFQKQFSPIVTGTSSEPRRASTFHDLVENIKERLYDILTSATSPTLTPQIPRMLKILTWAQQQANISPHIEAEDTRRNNEDTQRTNESLKLQKAQIEVEIQAERLRQEQQLTTATRKTCQHLEEMYGKNSQITNNLEKTSADLQQLFRVNLANLEILLTHICEEIQKGNREAVERLIKEADAQQAELCKKLTNVGALQPQLIGALQLSNQFSTEMTSKLVTFGSQIQNLQKELSELKNQISNKPDAIQLEKFIYESEQRLKKDFIELHKTSAQNIAFAPTSKAFPIDRGPEFETE